MWILPIALVLCGVVLVLAFGLDLAVWGAAMLTGGFGFGSSDGKFTSLKVFFFAIWVGIFPLGLFLAKRFGVAPFWSR